MKPRTTPTNPSRTSSTSSKPKGRNPKSISAKRKIKNQKSKIKNSLDWRHNGKVARLPKALRDKINLMIQDGLSYPAIIESLGDAGKELNVVNLCRWRRGGYKDWLLEQSWLADIRTRQESAADLTSDFDATNVNHAALQLGSLHIFNAMRTLGPGMLDKKLGGDSAAFARLIHALARASRETTQLQKYRETCAKVRAALQPLRDPKRTLSDNERRSLVLMVDDILGLPHQDAPPSDQASPTPSTDDLPSHQEPPPVSSTPPANGELSLSPSDGERAGVRGSDAIENQKSKIENPSLSAPSDGALTR